MNLRVRFAATHSGYASTRVLLLRLPTCLANARKLAFARQLTEAHTTQAKLAIHRMRTAAALAAVLPARRVLRCARCFDDHRCLSHISSSQNTRLCHASPTWVCLYNLRLCKREVEGIKQGLAFLVCFGSSNNSDVHTTGTVDAVVVDLGENQLLGNTHGVVAPTIKALG